MKMTVCTDYPPNIEQIREVFGRQAIKHAVFTYGSTVYVPQGKPMEAHLIAHEEVHVLQQGDNPAGWWERYLADPEFRLQQELEAYRTQYEFICGHYDRGTRRVALRHISSDLASPMYGNLLDKKAAADLIAKA